MCVCAQQMHSLSVCAYTNCEEERRCCSHTVQPVHRVLPQVSKPKLCLLHPKNEKIYNPDTSVNTVIKPLLCANKHSYHILLINEILTMVKKLFEEKCKHNGENYKLEEGGREL